jgi:hypothetical protein
MPQAGSKVQTNWISKYGDSAESWELFTIGFHSRKLMELDKRLTAIQAQLALYPDPNEIVTEGDLEIDPNIMNTASVPADYHYDLYYERKEGPRILQK